MCLNKVQVIHSAAENAVPKPITEFPITHAVTTKREISTLITGAERLSSPIVRTRTTKSISEPSQVSLTPGAETGPVRYVQLLEPQHTPNPGPSQGEHGSFSPDLNHQPFGGTPTWDRQIGRAQHARHRDEEQSLRVYDGSPYDGHNSHSARWPSDWHSRPASEPHQLAPSSTPVYDVDHVTALYDFDPQPGETDRLNFQAGEVIRVLTRDPTGWWYGELDGRIGWFPGSYVCVDATRFPKEEETESSGPMADHACIEVTDLWDNRSVPMACSSISIVGLTWWRREPSPPPRAGSRTHHQQSPAGGRYQSNYSTSSVSSMSSYNSASEESDDQVSDPDRDFLSGVCRSPQALATLRTAHARLQSIIATLIGHVNFHSRSSDASSKIQLIETARMIAEPARYFWCLADALDGHRGIGKAKRREVATAKQACKTLDWRTGEIMEALNDVLADEPTISEDGDKTRTLEAATGALAACRQCAKALKRCLRTKTEFVINIDFVPSSVTPIRL
ncbi:hypothetical protein FRC01_001486 [Tulasnella sp. 417]|nr:hypothetical protein FRC01_001486 [Tulasnella sp. 417]